MFKLQGKLIRKNDTRQVGKNNFEVREFVIEDSSGQYPQIIQFQLSTDKCALIDSFKLGEDIEVKFNLRGREWVNPQSETKVFNTLEAWQITSMGSPEAMASSLESSSDVTNPDDLPF